jgi:hypothetical protein
LADLYIKDILIEGDIDETTYQQQPVQVVNRNTKPTHVSAIYTDAYKDRTSTQATFNLNNLLKKEPIAPALSLTGDENNVRESAPPSDNETIGPVDVKSNGFKSSIVEQAKFSIGYLTEVTVFEKYLTDFLLKSSFFVNQIKRR